MKKVRVRKRAANAENPSKDVIEEGLLDEMFNDDNEANNEDNANYNQLGQPVEVVEEHVEEMEQPEQEQHQPEGPLGQLEELMSEYEDLIDQYDNAAISDVNFEIPTQDPMSQLTQVDEHIYNMDIGNEETERVEDGGSHKSASKLSVRKKKRSSITSVEKIGEDETNAATPVFEKGGKEVCAFIMAKGNCKWQEFSPRRRPRT